MRERAAASMAERRAEWLDAAGQGALSGLLAATPRLEVGPEAPSAADASLAVVLSVLRLQDVADYRAALQAWFRALRVGGSLVVVVPHAFLYERQLSLPSPWNPGQRRLYTPRSLLEEVEEALEPNSYRVRQLRDLDDGYDYGLDLDDVPRGRSEIVLVLERIAAPSWRPRESLPAPSPRPRRDAPDYAFEPPATRVEQETRPRPTRVLILKPDHVGDFVMGLPALERARELFAGAQITLVVGSWNLEMACDLGLADRVIGFDAFPRNASEAEADVAGQAGLFQRAVTGEYDLAIDLRTHPDTRRLLRLVKAELRAGLGTRAQFPFLDIFLPVDFTREEPEAAREFLFDSGDFACQGSARRTERRVISRPDRVERDCAIVWGPYRPLRAGRYIFEPYIDVEPGAGALMLDVALDAERVAQALVQGPTQGLRLPFEVEAVEGASFEFRIWAVEGLPTLEASFMGGRLIRQGAGSTLHQSEYLRLLLELVAMRLGRTGVLREAATP